MLKKWLAGMFQPELDALKAEYEQKLAAQASEHSQALSQSRQEFEQLQRERDSLQGQLDTAQKENRHLQEQLQQAQAARQGSADEQNQKLLSLETQAQELRTQHAAESQARFAAETQQAAIEAQFTILQQQLDEANQKIEKLEAEKNLLQVRAQMQQMQPAPVVPPATPAAAAAAAPIAPATGELIRPPARAKKKVLIVDDAATTRILQKNMLESAGYEVVMGNDGQQGQNMMSEHLPDLVITDIEMPRMNGFELTTWIKQSPYREVPVLMVTSHSDESFQQKGLQAGADGFVEKKSFNQKTFLEIIQHYV